MSDLGNLVLKVRNRVQSFIKAADYVDLTHFCRLILRYIDDSKVNKSEKVKISKAAKNVLSLLRDNIINYKSVGTEVENAFGLSIWFPVTAKTLENRLDKYSALNFNKGNRKWIKFLKAWTEYLDDRTKLK